MINRRRFLSIAAAATLTPAWARKSTVWHGRAFGADISIRLEGEKSLAGEALDAALDTIGRLESYFSIYDPNSYLSELNREGELAMPPEFARLIGHVDTVNKSTGGLFDPTVQPLFAAMLQSGGDLSPQKDKTVRSTIGWQHVNFDNRTIQFAKPHMAITLNGIAQGYATDRVSEVLKAHGFERTLVNIGEHRTNNVAVSLAIEDSDGNRLKPLVINNGAVATSTISGFTFANGKGHILQPVGSGGHGRWKTISVHAPTATVADALSTALILTPDAELSRALIVDEVIHSAILQDMNGTVLREF